MNGKSLAAAFVLAVSAGASTLAQAQDLTEVIKINMVPLPTFEAADTGSERRDLDAAAIAEQALPWEVLEMSANGMYLVELKGDRVWIIDSTVKINETATASPLVPEAVNMADPDLAGSRGYGN